MSESLSAPESSTSTQAGEPRGRMPSLKVVAGCLLMVALVMALGMTGGQVRQLADRMTTLENERDGFERRFLRLRQDNQRLLGRLRDYQEVLGVAQQSNISLSKRLVNRDMAVNDLQDTLDSILTEKYATEKALRGEIASLEEQRVELNAEVAALGAAVAAQGKEIASLEKSYHSAERDLADAASDNNRLLAENDRYLGMMSEMQDALEALRVENRELADDFDELRAQSGSAGAPAGELDALRGAGDLPFGRDPELFYNVSPPESDTPQAEGEAGGAGVVADAGAASA